MFSITFTLRKPSLLHKSRQNGSHWHIKWVRPVVSPFHPSLYFSTLNFIAIIVIFPQSCMRRTFITPKCRKNGISRGKSARSCIYGIHDEYRMCASCSMRRDGNGDGVSQPNIALHLNVISSAEFS